MLEDSFYKWTQDLVRGSSLSFEKVPLTENHLSLLLKVKGFPPVARELIRRVRPASECREIRLNLQHSLLRKYALGENSANEQQKTYTRLLSSIKDTRNEVAREAQELKRLVEKEEELMREEEELRRQISLLDVAVEDTATRTKKLHQWSTEVNQLLPHYSNSPTWEEEAACEEVKTVLEKLKVLKKSQLPFNASTNFSDDEKVWRLVESLLKRHRPSFVMKSLSSITLKETAFLNDSIKNIDLIADAKALRLKFCHGRGLVDELCPEEVLETVESMLVEMSGKHIKNHFRNDKKRQEIQTARDSLANIVKMVQSAAEEVYSDPSTVCEVMTLCDASLKVAGLKAFLATSSKVIHDLSLKVSTAAHLREAMSEKYERIHFFDEQVETTVSELQFLTLEASQNLDRMKEIKTQIASIVEKSLSSLVFPIPLVKRSFSREVEVVLELPIEALRSSHKKDCIAPLLPLAPVDRPYSSLDSVSSIIPYVTSWDNLIEIMRQKKLQLRQHENILSHKIEDLKAFTLTMKTHALSAAEVKDLCLKANSHDTKLESELVPLLNACETSHKEMEQKLEQLQNSVEEWWNQPGPVIKNYLKRKST